MLKPYVERYNRTVYKHTQQLLMSWFPTLISSIYTTRLTNSDVVQNLDAIVLHLSGSQHLDLEMLLQEFENLFSDVPYRRGQIYWHVDVDEFRAFIGK